VQPEKLAVPVSGYGIIGPLLDLHHYTTQGMLIIFSPHGKYNASHSQVAPENVGLQKEQKSNTFAFIPVMKCGYVFWEFTKRKLVTRKDKPKPDVETLHSTFSEEDFLILSFFVTNFQQHFITGVTCKCIALLFFL
jgi:hypothetical protein